MRKALFGLFLLVLFGGAIVCVQELNQARTERTRAAEAEQRLHDAEARAAQQEQRNKVLQQKLQQTRLQASSEAGEVQSLQRQLATATNSVPAPEPSPGAKLFKDPQMKATMKKQQMENVERMVNKLVNGDLIKQLGLNTEQAGYLKELLKRKNAPGADIMIELMAGELSDDQMAQMGKHFKQQMTETDGEIKAYLGEEAYKTLDWQEKSQEERSRLKEFQKKLAGLGQS